MYVYLYISWLVCWLVGMVFVGWAPCALLIWQSVYPTRRPGDDVEREEVHHELLLTLLGFPEDDLYDAAARDPVGEIPKHSSRMMSIEHRDDELPVV